MKIPLRFVVEPLLLILLSGTVLVATVVAAQQLLSDVKLQYFVIGYVVAIHSDLVRWIWKHLHVEKGPA